MGFYCTADMLLESFCMHLYFDIGVGYMGCNQMLQRNGHFVFVYNFRDLKMFHFRTVTGLPERYGGRGMYGGGLVESAGMVYWGRGGVNGGRVYRFNQKVLSNETWERVISGGLEYGSRLAVCGGRLVVVGGLKGAGVVEYIKKVMVRDDQKWIPMSVMPVGCAEPCVISVGGGGLIVMGGQGLNGRRLNTVQVYDVKKQTWFEGPTLPLPCQSMSAVVHGDLVFMMGGDGMGKAVWCASISELVRSIVELFCFADTT